MVAEPVQATLNTLNYYYLKTSDFLATQQENLVNYDYSTKLSDLNPFVLHFNKGPTARKGHETLLTKAAANILTHRRVYAGLLSVGIGIGSYYLFEHLQTDKAKVGTRACKKVQPKRRVPKLANGARRDVILIVGSPTEPLTRLIALDFEKRGFIVYLTILDEKDFKYIEANPITDDINYLNLNNSYSFEIQLAKFQKLLEVPVVPFPGAEPHKLSLKGVIFAPSLYFPIGPVENISIASWTKITDRFMVYTKLFSSGLLGVVRKNSGCRIILVTTSIISSLNMPYHAPENFLQNSVRHLFTGLTREIKHQGIQATQVKLGNLNVTNNAGASSTNAYNVVNSEIRSWGEDTRELYGDRFARTQARANPIHSTGAGTPLRDLYHILFDLVYNTGTNPSVVYCGAGARSYDNASKIIPESVLEFFLS